MIKPTPSLKNSSRCAIPQIHVTAIWKEEEWMCHLFFATSNNALLPFPLQTACSPLSPKLFRMELFRRGAIKVRNGRIGKGVVRRIVTMGGGHNYPTFPFPARNFTCIFTLLTSEALLYFNRLLRLSYNLMKLVRQGDNVGNIPDGRVLAIAEVAILERGYNRRAEFIMSGIRPFETGESDPILEIARETRGRVQLYTKARKYWSER